MHDAFQVHYAKLADKCKYICEFGVAFVDSVSLCRVYFINRSSRIKINKNLVYLRIYLSL